MWPGAAVQGPQAGAQKLWVEKAMEQVQQARVLGRQIIWEGGGTVTRVA